MKLSTSRVVSFVSIVFLFVTGLPAQQRDRTAIPEKYKWNLADLYPTQSAWKESKQKVFDALPELEQYRGTLGTSASRLLGCLTLTTNLTMEIYRLYAYASLSYDQDTRVQANLAMVQELDMLAATFGAKTAFIEPEILKIDPNKVTSFVAQQKGLAAYRHYLADLMRRKAHTGTEGEERILAEASLVANTGYDIYDVFSNSEFPYPEITLSDGKAVRLDRAAFTLYRASSNREDRKKVFSAFFGKLDSFRRTYGAQLNAAMNRDVFYEKARNYNSCLESALDADSIPTSVYYNLVANVDSNLAAFHRYLNLRKRILGLKELHYYDLYAPLLPGMNKRYDYNEAEKNVIASLQPMGEEYLSVVRKALDERWVDVYPSEGKTSGGYSNGIYGVHPYILLNYNGLYEDMSMLAHEMGHAMHSYFADKHQPFPTSQYAIFTAEVASTVNQCLLADYMLGKAKDDSMRLSILGSYLENIRGTLFRQTQFAEFELKIHEMTEQGVSLTGDVLDSVYYDIVKKYYGDKDGICKVDDEVKSEWIYIPHFYYDFYVYKYATSFTAAVALSEKLVSGDTTAKRKYIEFLSAGGSDYPIEVLKRAGIDMTTGEPIALTMKKMNRIMDEMDAILDRMKR